MTVLPQKATKKPLRRRGTNPQFNEQLIIDCVASKAGVETIGPLQSSAMMALVDAYDRKVERKYFCSLALGALALHTAMGRLHTTNAVRGILADAGHPVGKEMDAIVDNVTKVAEARRLELQDMVKLLVQCPTEDDPIS
jgi:hypothetical protein